MNPKIQLDEINTKLFKNFFSYYQSYDGIVVDNRKKTILKHYEEKRCRFCGKSYPEVKFKNDAHVISQFLGNRTLVSNFECNTCNSLFSKYESSLAAFINPYRSILQIKGGKGKGYPKHKEPDEKFSVFTENDNITIETFDKNLIKVNQSSKTLSLQPTIQSYIPINIYKVFLKIGLCFIKEDEIRFYGKAIEFLQDYNNNNFKYTYFAKVYKTFIPGIYNSPTSLFIFNIKKKTKNYPNHIIVLAHNNFIYQYILPFYKNKIYKRNDEITFPLFPIIIDISYFKKYGNYTQEVLDLSSTEKIKGNKENISIKFTNSKKIKIRQ